MVIDWMIDGSIKVVVMFAVSGSLSCNAFRSPTASSKRCVSTVSTLSVTVMTSSGSLFKENKKILVSHFGYC